MAVPTVFLFAGAIVALAVTLWGLVSPRTSLAVGLVALVVALLAAGGAWYAWVETESVRWAVGYGLVALLALGSAGRQFAGCAGGKPTAGEWVTE